jgi:hypothetical protein
MAAAEFEAGDLATGGVAAWVVSFVLLGKI